MELFESSHRRLNILTNEWVLVSPHRTKRPWQGKKDKAQSLEEEAYDPGCYLCPGNLRANGERNPDYSSTYSFKNDFAALEQDNPSNDFKEGLLVAKKETGICKVVCFSPDHSLTLAKMSKKDIVKVVQLWQEEYQTLGQTEGINHVQIFENKGAIMGCSNPHPHGQIWAQNSIPEIVLKKQAQQEAHFKNTGKSLLGQYLQQELKLNERIIYTNDHFVALVPFWAVWPYETMIVPRRPLPHIGYMTAEEQESFADCISHVTIKYDNLFEVPFPYSSGIHQSPTDHVHDAWHFHMSFYPPLLRSATVKKFMVGYEMFANPQRDITAEQAAATLKQLGSVHYSNQ